MTLTQIAIVVCLLAFIAVGHFFKKRKVDSIESYTLNEGKLGWFSISAGISMTFAGGAAILNMASLGYTFKWYTLVDPVALIIGICVVVLLFDKYRKGKGITIASLLSGEHVKLNIVIGCITSFVFILIIAAQFVALSKLISPYFPDVNPLLITFILSTLVFSYVYVGGFSSVTRTDILQLVFVWLFLIFPVAYFAITNEIAGSEKIDYSHRFMDMPINYIILFSIPIVFIPLSQDINIRAKSSKSRNNGILGFIVGALLYMLVVIAASYIGIYLGESNIVLEDPETAYAVFFQNIFSGYAFIGVVAAVAAIVSTLDSYALNGVTSFSKDILSHSKYFKAMKTATLIKVSGVIIYVAALSIALFFNQILGLVLTALLTYISVLLPAAIAKWLGIHDTHVFSFLVIMISLIVAMELFQVSIEPKAVIYPVIGLLIMSVFYVYQRASK